VTLIDLIQKIQKKPRYIRIQILWLAVFICMFLVVSLWATSLKHSLTVASQETKTAKESFQSLKKEIPSLKETLKASLGVFFEEDLSEELNEIESPAEEVTQEETDQLEKESEIKPIKLPLSD